jgi:hypothetical protein
MTVDLFTQLNWIAVVVSAIIYFAIGEVWFTDIAFGRSWRRAKDSESARQGPGIDGTATVVPLVAALVTAVTTGLLARAIGSDTFVEGVLLGLVVGIGYAVTLTAVDAALDTNRPHPWLWFAITGAYHLLGLLIVAVIVSMWR